MADKPESPITPTEEPEALSASQAGDVIDVLDKHRTTILFAIAAAAVAICAFLVIGQLKKQKHLEAAEAYSMALAKGEVAAYDGVVVEYPGSIPAGNALLSKSELQINQGKSQDAIATLETFVADYGSHPRNPQGIFALGNLYHVADDLEKAAEYYNRAITVQPDGELTPLARIRLGDIALQNGDKDLADQNYQEAYTNHPGTPFFGYAEDKIALLSVGNPPVVERPVEPEPEVVIEDAPAAPAAEKPAPKAPAKGKGKAKAKNNGKGKEASKGKEKPAVKPKGGKGKGSKQKAPQQNKAKPKAATPAPAEPAAAEATPPVEKSAGSSEPPATPAPAAPTGEPNAAEE